MVDWEECDFYQDGYCMCRDSDGKYSYDYCREYGMPICCFECVRRYMCVRQETEPLNGMGLKCVIKGQLREKGKEPKTMYEVVMDKAKNAAHQSFDENKNKGGESD